MTTALARSVAARIRAADAATRRAHRLAAAGMTAIVAILIAVCCIAGAWGSLALVGVAFVPLWLFVVYRAYKLPGRELVERAITRPDSITSLLKVVTPRSRILGIELGPEMLALRFASESDLDDTRRALAALAPDASVVPPLPG
ncbi:MAG TPA: hypothetical protein VGO00_07870 [Kofleriaceae bacterium]|nr:hypothetical protein [Kofleriaceae bacterium]